MRYRFQSGDEVFEINLDRQGEHYRAVVDGQAVEFEVLDLQPGEISLRFGGLSGGTAGGRILRLYWAGDGGRKWISSAGCTYLLEKPVSRRLKKPGEEAGEDSIRAPMPAQVRSVEVAAGEQVEKGQTLLLLEAMKMEIRIQAPRAGRISSLSVTPGQPVERDQVLAVISEK
jgi:acetyl/propionyl-CoA carboxylase alpha subunit